MKTIHELSEQLDILYTQQKLEEKAVFNQMEDMLKKANPIHFISQSIENILSKNKLDEELPKMTIRLIINQLSDRFLSKSPVIKDTIQTFVGDLLVSNLFEKKSEAPNTSNEQTSQLEKDQAHIQL
jgi:hypothetical protein